MSRYKARGLQIVNGRYDVPGVANDVRFQGIDGQNQTRRRRVLYPAPTAKADRSIVAGEVLYEVTRNYSTQGDQQPHVRSCLNGLTFYSKVDDDTFNSAKLGSIGDAQRLNMKKVLDDIRDGVRFTGLSQKTVIYDATQVHMSPSDDPTVVTLGQITTINTGDKHISMGDALEAYLPDPRNTGPQYNDGINTFSSNRFVPGVRPLIWESEFAEELKQNKDLEYAIKQAIIDMLDGNVTTARTTWNKFETDTKMDRNALEARVRGGDVADAAAAQKQLDHIEILDDLLHAIRALTIYRMKNVICVPTTGAEPGVKLDVVVHQMQNLHARARTRNEKAFESLTPMVMMM